MERAARHGALLRCDKAACAHYFHGIPGTQVKDLTSNSKYPASPDKTVGLTSGNFETKSGHGNDYGAMLTGFVKVRKTGEYIFYTDSDDSSEVWVSKTPNSKDNLIKVVELVGCCKEVEGSVRVKWQAGHLYYIQAMVKEGGGGDYLKVGMRIVKGGTPDTIGVKYMPIPMKLFAMPANQVQGPGLVLRKLAPPKLDKESNAKIEIADAAVNRVYNVAADKDLFDDLAYVIEEEQRRVLGQIWNHRCIGRVYNNRAYYSYVGTSSFFGDNEQTPHEYRTTHCKYIRGFLSSTKGLAREGDIALALGRACERNADVTKVLKESMYFGAKCIRCLPAQNAKQGGATINGVHYNKCLVKKKCDPSGIACLLL